MEASPWSNSLFKAPPRSIDQRHYKPLIFQPQKLPMWSKKATVEIYDIYLFYLEVKYMKHFTFLGGGVIVSFIKLLELNLWELWVPPKLQNLLLNWLFQKQAENSLKSTWILLENYNSQKSSEGCLYCLEFKDHRFSNQSGSLHIRKKGWWLLIF